jgi:hypothetical protein
MIIHRNMKLRKSRVQASGGQFATCLINGKDAVDGESVATGDVLTLRWDGVSAIDPLEPSSHQPVPMSLFEEEAS